MAGIYSRNWDSKIFYLKKNNTLTEYPQPVAICYNPDYMVMCNIIDIILNMIWGEMKRYGMLIGKLEEAEKRLKRFGFAEEDYEKTG